MKETKRMEQVLIRMTKDMKLQVKKLAGKRGLTLNAFILQIIWEWIERNEK